MAVHFSFTKCFAVAASSRLMRNTQQQEAYMAFLCVCPCPLPHFCLVKQKCEGLPVSCHSIITKLYCRLLHTPHHISLSFRCSNLQFVVSNMTLILSIIDGCITRITLPESRYSMRREVLVSVAVDYFPINDKWCVQKIQLVSLPYCCVSFECNQMNLTN